MLGRRAGVGAAPYRPNYRNRGVEQAMEPYLTREVNLVDQLERE